MKVVVTGGAGFLGLHFVERLLREDKISMITIYDALTYCSLKEEVFKLRQLNKIDFVLGDIRDKDKLIQTIEGASVVVHLAAETFVDSSIDNPMLFHEVNVVGTLNVLDACRINRVKRLVHVSTDEVWGEILGQNKVDESFPYHPRNPYAASKAAADQFVKAWSSTWDLDIVIAHFTNLYGIRQYPEKLIPKMAILALLGNELPLYGDGSHSRSWLYVADAVEGLLAVLLKGRSGENYIIGSNEEVSNLEIAKIIIANLNPESTIRFVVDRPGHDKRYAVNCTKAKDNINWEPAWTLNNGLKKVCDWYRTNQAWWTERKDKALIRKGLNT